MPFVETALIGDDKEEDILHVTGITYRVIGAGSLVQTLYGLGNVSTQAILPLSMAGTPGRELTRLCNFKSQRTKLRLETNEIDERFEFSRIILQVKPFATNFPM